MQELVQDELVVDRGQRAGDALARPMRETTATANARSPGRPAAIQVPLIQSCEVRAAADAEAALAITSVRAFSRRWRSSSLSRVHRGEAMPRRRHGPVLAKSMVGALSLVPPAGRGGVGCGRMRGPGSGSADVVVIGAGLAGLSAAREVAAAGASRVRAVEARGPGGRPRAEPGDRRRQGRGGSGAEWIGPTQDRLAALAASSEWRPSPPG